MKDEDLTLDKDNSLAEDLHEVIIAHDMRATHGINIDEDEEAGKKEIKAVILENRETSLDKF